MTTEPTYQLPVTPSGMRLSNLAPELWKQAPRGEPMEPMQIPIRQAILDIEREAAVQALNDRCTFCWHDKGHHVHWSDDDIGSCVLIMASSGRQHHKCPCEEYVAPAVYHDAAEAER